MNLSTLLNHQMQAPDYKILGYLGYLAWRQGQRSPSGAKYCYPSQRKIGEVTGYCRQWVNEGIRHLVNLGLLHKTRRRKKGDYWPTCLYKLSRLGWQVRSITTKIFKPVTEHVVSRRHIDSLRSEKIEERLPARPEMAGILAEWYARGGRRPAAPPGS